MFLISFFSERKNIETKPKIVVFRDLIIDGKKIKINFGLILCFSRGAKWAGGTMRIYADSVSKDVAPVPAASPTHSVAPSTSSKRSKKKKRKKSKSVSRSGSRSSSASSRSSSSASSRSARYV